MFDFDLGDRIRSIELENLKEIDLDRRRGRIEWRRDFSERIGDRTGRE